MLAFEVLDAMARYGASPIPVIGYDDIQEQVHLPRRLTTIGADKQQIVEEGGDLMLSIIAGETHERVEKVLPVFLVKGTT
jgi:DNA-binding LacI/PurR family transcriptional regulator